LHWEQTLDKSKLEGKSTAPFCCLLRSQEQRNVSKPSDDPKKEAELVLTKLTELVAPAIKDLSRRQLMVVDAQSMAQKIIDAATAEEDPVVPAPGSLEAAIVEAGIENLTPTLKAALVHQRFIADTELSEEELSAADHPPVEDPDADQPVADAEKFNEVEEPVRRSLRTGAALNLSMSGVGVEGRDPSRGFLCRPEFIDYGNIQAGVKYGSAVTIMNGGIDSSRFAVKKPKTCDVKYKTGMVAPGMSVRMQVYFCSAEPGEVQQELQITTESDIFRIPIRANVLTEENFDQLAAHERSKATVVQ